VNVRTDTLIVLPTCLLNPAEFVELLKSVPAIMNAVVLLFVNLLVVTNTSVLVFKVTLINLLLELKEEFVSGTMLAVILVLTTVLVMLSAMTNLKDTAVNASEDIKIALLKEDQEEEFANPQLLLHHLLVILAKTLTSMTVTLLELVALLDLLPTLVNVFLDMPIVHLMLRISQVVYVFLLNLFASIPTEMIAILLPSVVKLMIRTDTLVVAAMVMSIKVPILLVVLVESVLLKLTSVSTVA